jgi:hypothetical protein
VLLLRSVMSAVPGLSKNCLECQTILGTAVCCEGCVTAHKQAVPHCVCAERSVRTVSTGQVIHRVVPNVVADNCDLIIIY